ncbi:MAG: alpha-galactosidase [Eubacteriales bacterium]
MKTRLPDLISIYSEEKKTSFTDCTGAFDDVRFSAELRGNSVFVSVCAEKTPLRYIRLRWHFLPREKRSDLVRIYGDAWERGGGDLEWRGIVPERCMPWFCLVSNGSDSREDVSGRFTEGFGVKVRPGAMCFWQYDAAGVTLWMDVRCGGLGVILKGRELFAGEIIFREYRNMSAFSAGQSFCREMCPDPLRPETPVYGSNNWYYAYGKSSHGEILRDAQIVGELCAGNKNRPFMVIDDGWTQNPKNGPWNRGKAEFPDMPGLAAEIKKLGVRPGIWVRYIYDENNVCGLPDEWHFAHDANFLDPSRPEVLGYIRETTERFVNWGYELIKFDCSTQDILGRRGYRVPYSVAADGWCFADRSKTSAEIIMDFYRAVARAAGRKTVLIGCATISHLSAGLVHIGRTGADINGVNWDITRRMGVNTLAFRMMHHRALFDADADCVGITGELPWELVRQWLKALSKSGTPLFVSCRPGVLDEGQLNELREAFSSGAEQKDVLVPMDWMENICPEKWMLNGEEVRFDWYADGINPMFAGKN